MTLDEALELLQCNSSELAKKLGISTSAIAQWNKKKIPLGREYQVIKLSTSDQESNQNQDIEPYHTPESVITHSEG